MKKVLFSLFFIGLFLTPALADYRVDSVSVSADVSANGQAQVNATIALTFDAVATEVTIPLPESHVTHASAGNYRFSLEETDKGANMVVRRRSGFAGTETFLIRYTVPYTDDGDTEADAFSLGLLSSRWERDIGSCTFQVLMPDVFEAEPEIISGYHGALSASEAGLTVTDTGFTGSVGQRMAFDSLDVSLELPEGYFHLRSATVPVISVTFVTLGMLVILLLCVVYWRAKLWFPREESTPRLLLPEGILPCQLPMVLDGSTCDVPAMILEWANLGYLSISRARNGTVLLTRRMNMGSERSRGEQRLFAKIFGQKYRVAATPGRFSGAAAGFRRVSRRSLYRVIFDRASGNPVLIQMPCRLLLAVGIGNLAAHMLPEGGGFVVLAVLIGMIGFLYSIYLHTAAAKFAAHRTYDLISILCAAILAGLLPLSLMAGALPEMLMGLSACLFSAIATAPGPRRSKRGIDAMAQAKGCRTFYRRAAWRRLQTFQGRNSRFFQIQFPRAMALGADREFALRFERIPIPTPEWLELPLTGTRSAEALRKELLPILRQLRDAFR